MQHRGPDSYGEAKTLNPVFEALLHWGSRHLSHPRPNMTRIVPPR